MGVVIVQPDTTKNPISLIGLEAGICWGANIEDEEKNYKRGLDCLSSNHGRTLEFPQVYLTISGYSARFMRELYTHIGGAPSRLQASTRYINYEKGFEYIIPDKINNNEEARKLYIETMDHITNTLYKLEYEYKIPREDSANLLPLGMESKMVLRTNLRNLIDMSHQRLCSRAYWEFREFMKDLMRELGNYSAEWKYIIETYFEPKCELYGFCTESKSCGRKPKKEELMDALRRIENVDD